MSLVQTPQHVLVLACHLQGLQLGAYGHGVKVGLTFLSISLKYINPLHESSIAVGDTSSGRSLLVSTRGSTFRIYLQWHYTVRQLAFSGCGLQLCITICRQS